MSAGCHDCGRPYGDPGFPDLLVPDEAWNAISPSGGHGGLLCPSCLVARLDKAGFRNVRAFWGSGPLAEKPASELEHAIDALRYWRDRACRAEESLRAAGLLEEQ